MTAALLVLRMRGRSELCLPDGPCLPEFNMYVHARCNARPHVRERCAPAPGGCYVKVIAPFAIVSLEGGASGAVCRCPSALRSTGVNL